MKVNKKTYMLPAYPCESDLWKYLASTTRPIVVYGMGNGADKLIRRLDSIGVSVSDFFASDDFVRGQSFHGKKVLSLEDVENKYRDFIILVSFGTRVPKVMNSIKKLSEKYELYLPDMPVCDEEYFDCQFYNDNYDKILKAMNLLRDKRSIFVFCDIINYKLTGKLEYLLSSSDDEDSYRSFTSPERYENTVDAGAYNGDTITELCKVSKNLKSVVAIEPDLKNYTKLVHATKSLGFTILPYNCCAWNSDGERVFSASGNRNSSLVSSSYEHRANIVRTHKIDTLVEERYIDYIKYDVEGAEQEAIEGSRATILRCLPDLLVSVYHKSEDIFSLILQINDITDKYTFSLRRNVCFPAWEMNLYAYASDWVRPKKTSSIEDFTALLQTLVPRDGDHETRSIIHRDLPRIPRRRKNDVNNYGFYAKITAEISYNGNSRTEELYYTVNSDLHQTFTAKHLAAHVYIEKCDDTPMLVMASTRRRSWMADGRKYKLTDGASYSRVFCISDDEERDMFIDELPEQGVYEFICLKIDIEKGEK